MLFMNYSYSTDLETEYLMHLQKLPKSELHLHLSGSYPKKYLYSIASPEQRVNLEAALMHVAQRIDYHQVFAVFQSVSQIINTEEKVQQGVKALCDSLKEDGVAYVEIRSGLKNLGRGAEAYLNAILDGIRAENSPCFEACLLLSLQRNSTLSAAVETIDLAFKYQCQGVIGIDLSGDSTVGNIDLILPELLRAKEGGIPFVIHIGESSREQDQMKLLTLLNPARVGHGVHLCPEAADWIFSHQIPLEICLTSSVLVKMVDSFDQHPGLQLFRKGHPVAFCTDDPLLCSTSLSQELFLAHKEAGLTRDEVEKAALESRRYKINSR
jgi:adenosine deaminase